MIELHLHDLNRIRQPRSFFTGGAWLVGRYNVLLILKLQNPRKNTVHTYLPSLKITGKRTIHRLDPGPLSVLASSGFKTDRQTVWTWDWLHLVWWRLWRYSSRAFARWTKPGADAVYV